MRTSVLSLLGSLAVSAAWLPTDKTNIIGNVKRSSDFLPAGNGRIVQRATGPTGKIRGANLGSMFIIEPWMAADEWSTMGCGNAEAESDCVQALGQSKANDAWKDHWDRWATEDDFKMMASYGLNTVRIPVGFWIMESLVNKQTEHFPQGGLAYLERVCDWAATHGLYVIIDLHAVPGSQVKQQPFTGQYTNNAGFYNSQQYDRTYQWLQWMTNLIHTTDAYRTVGMIEVLNEPIPGQASLVSQYYPSAMSKIRDTENGLKVADADKLHVQFMDAAWGAGDPKSALKDTTFTAYDDHRYLKYDSTVPATQAGYLSASCSDAIGTSSSPLIVGEWSLSPADAVEHTAEFDPNIDVNKDFYKKWWAAQVMAYEKGLGWVFWSWRADLGDYRWSYKDAVSAGVIPNDPSQAYIIGAC